jgi:hypothetical protein
MIPSPRPTSRARDVSGPVAQTQEGEGENLPVLRPKVALMQVEDQPLVHVIVP